MFASSADHHLASIETDEHGTQFDSQFNSTLFNWAHMEVFIAVKG